MLHSSGLYVRTYFGNDGLSLFGSAVVCKGTDMGKQQWQWESGEK